MYPNNERTPLPSSAEEVLENIEELAGGGDPTPRINRQEAVHHLVDEKGYPKVEATEQIEVLLSRGYLYEVEGELRITPRD
jgi:hypothetical protein